MAAPRVYLDFDDVLCETFAELRAFARAAFGKDPAPGKEIHFDLHDSLELTDEEYGVFMDRFHAERLLAVPEIPGACETLRGWLRDGAAEPVVVTGRAAWCHADSLRWLEARGLGGVPVLHVDKYARFADPAAPDIVPFPALRDYGFALAVDDAPRALDALASARLCPYAVFPRPWNAAWAPPPGAAAPALPAADCSWAAIDAFVRSLPSPTPNTP